MPSTRKNLMWLFLPIAIALSAIVGVVIVVTWASQNSFHMPPCEAMRPYIQYHGTMYFAASDSSLTSSDLGSAITTIGDGSDQATSCMPSGITVYNVKGYSSTSRLVADFQGLMLFEPLSPIPTPSPAASPIWQ